MSQIDFSNVASAPTPSTGKTTVYIDSADKKLKSKNDLGVVTDYSTASGAVTSLTGEVTASGPGAASATISNAAVIAKLLTGFASSTGNIDSTDSILSAIQKLARRQGNSLFGTGTDGIVTLIGNTTLVRDMYYQDLTINPSVTLFTNGFRIFAAGTLTNNGTIDRSGSNAVLGTGGVALVLGTLSAAVGGGTGGTSAAGTAGTASANSLGGTGGAGGTGGTTGGGAAGLVTLVTTNNGSIEVLNSSRQSLVARDLANTIITGGAGAGGGGGAGVGFQGGGGGGGAGVIVICAKNLIGSGLIRANGGDGADTVGANGAGGGAGGGGVLAITTENDTSLTSLTFEANAGAAGTGNGTGGNGNPGSIGRIFKVRS
jgi:hypothetical protein